MHGEVPRRPTATVDVTEWLEWLVRAGEAEHGDAVVTAVGDVDVPAGRVHANLGRDRLALEVVRQSGRGPESCQSTIRRVEVERHDRRVEFAHEEPDRQLGMEREMSRSGPGVEREFVDRRERVAVVVAIVDVAVHAIRAQIGGIHGVADRAGHDAVGVRSLLAASGPGTVMLVDGDHLAESAVGSERVGGDGAGQVVGDVQVPTVGVDADVAGRTAMAGGSIDRRQRAVDRVDAKGRDASALGRCCLVHGVEDVSARVRSEERRVLDASDLAELDEPAGRIGPVADADADR